MLLGVQLIPEITEIHLEWWIGDNVIELFQRLAVPMVRMRQSVSLNDVGNRMDQIVQDEVQTQQTR